MALVEQERRANPLMVFLCMPTNWQRKKPRLFWETTGFVLYYKAPG